jgi:RES domain-containing protein
MADLRKARDLALLDAIDKFKREPFAQSVWRTVKEGRDPLQGAPTRSRWCNGTFETLYTALERDGAVAEIHALLASQPVFPSKVRWHVHRISVRCARALRLADMPTLAQLGVDTGNYKSRTYVRTQEIADAAYFLDFDGLLAPSARWNCMNLVIFTERVAPDERRIEESEGEAIDWDSWKRSRSR